jgi:hypothetical protein
MKIVCWRQPESRRDLSPEVQEMRMTGQRTNISSGMIREAFGASRLCCTPLTVAGIIDPAKRVGIEVIAVVTES